MSIDTLYKEFKTGKKEAEKQLFEYLTVRFRILATKRIWNKENAEEIVQESLIAVFKHHEQAPDQADFAAWAHKVLDNRINNYLRVTMRRTEIMNKIRAGIQYMSGKLQSTNPDLKRKLLDCFRKLCKTNRRYARILNLHYHGYNVDEICKRMGIEINNCHVILSRSRSKLDLCLKTGEIN
ncbi:MAG: sigma-70 family RNA polymerase sigma factor [candidate division Zixibacteria bacterium]|nr:sigma-70 family RNA polymerase sigma factor [candidate division Zixibacteria bacterium]